MYYVLYIYIILYSIFQDPALRGPRSIDPAAASRRVEEDAPGAEYRHVVYIYSVQYLVYSI